MDSVWKSVVVAGAVGWLGGCNGARTVDVIGNVTANGKPVVYGFVSILASDQSFHSAEIRPDGTFELPKVPQGPVRIAVNSPNPRVALLQATSGGRPRDGQGGLVTNSTSRKVNPVQNLPQVAPEIQKSWFPISDQFGDAQTSGLLGEVKPGKPLEVRLPL